MARPKNRLTLTLLLSISAFCAALAMPAAAQSVDSDDKKQQQNDQQAEQTIEELQAPLYSAFTERYLLDEVKNLRQQIADARVELTEKIVDKEIDVSSKALTYATDTVTYFFYLIAGASTLLVLIGWNSLRDIKERVGAFANDEIRRITASYEKRLDKLEDELHRKSRHIAQAQEEIELTNEIHSLWLKASQENTPQSKIAIYDQILQLRPDDVEALKPMQRYYWVRHNGQPALPTAPWKSTRKTATRSISVPVPMPKAVQPKKPCAICRTPSIKPTHCACRLAATSALKACCRMSVFWKWWYCRRMKTVKKTAEQAEKKTIAKTGKIQTGRSEFYSVKKSASSSFRYCWPFSVG